jgi:hypothetical protein
MTKKNRNKLFNKFSMKLALISNNLYGGLVLSITRFIIASQLPGTGPQLTQKVSASNDQEKVAAAAGPDGMDDLQARLDSLRK